MKTISTYLKLLHEDSIWLSVNSQHYCIYYCIYTLSTLCTYTLLCYIISLIIILSLILVESHNDRKNQFMFINCK